MLRTWLQLDPQRCCRAPLCPLHHSIGPRSGVCFPSWDRGSRHVRSHKIMRPFCLFTTFPRLVTSVLAGKLKSFTCISITAHYFTVITKSGSYFHSLSINVSLVWSPCVAIRAIPYPSGIVSVSVSGMLLLLLLLPPQPYITIERAAIRKTAHAVLLNLVITTPTICCCSVPGIGAVM